MKKHARNLMILVAALALLLAVVGSALAQDRVVVANSYDDWSLDGTQGYNHWTYNCFYPAVYPGFAYDMTWTGGDHWALPEWGGLPIIYRDHSVTQGGGAISSTRQWTNTSYSGSMHVTTIVTPTDGLALTAKLFKNGTQVVWSQDISDAGFHGYDFDIAVSAGDVLGFAIDPRYDINGADAPGRTVYDKVIFSVEVPEPSSMIGFAFLLTSSGALKMAASRRRKA